MAVVSVLPPPSPSPAQAAAGAPPDSLPGEGFAQALRHAQRDGAPRGEPNSTEAQMQARARAQARAEDRAAKAPQDASKATRSMPPARDAAPEDADTTAASADAQPGQRRDIDPALDPSALVPTIAPADDPAAGAAETDPARCGSMLAMPMAAMVLAQWPASHPLRGGPADGPGTEGRAAVPAGATASDTPAAWLAAQGDAPPGRQAGAEDEASTGQGDPGAMQAELGAAEPPQGQDHGAAGHPGFSATLAAVGGAASGAAAAARETFVRHVPARVDSPDFAPSLGTQVSLLVREGVQQARLDLHPAEMGPVRVQIALDGSHARVDFHADLAATRQAIESSLPALASALHEAGLTLAGGGVFQGQSGARGDGQPGPAAPGTGRTGQDATDGEAPAGTATAPARRGLVDLVA